MSTQIPQEVLNDVEKLKSMGSPLMASIGSTQHLATKLGLTALEEFLSTRENQAAYLSYVMTDGRVSRMV